MSDLQIALIILGAFIIAGVVVYNWMQERKLRREVTSDFIVPQADVLIDDFYIDADAYVDKELAHVHEKIKHADTAKFELPTKSTMVDAIEAPIDVDLIAKNASNLGEANTGEASQNVPKLAQHMLDDPNLDAPYDVIQLTVPNTAEAATTANEIIDIKIAHQQTVSNAKIVEQHQDAFMPYNPSVKAATTNNDIVEAKLYEQIQHMQVQLPDDIHTQTDLTAILYATKNISAAALNAFSSAFADSGLPTMTHGLDALEKWHLITHSARNAAGNIIESTYKQVACSIQLADRGGPIMKNLLNKFQFAVENIGLELNAHVEWQGSGDAMTRAIELDQFCIEVDQMVSVHLAQLETPIHGTKFRGLAEANGLTLHQDGKFYYDANTIHAPLFALIDANNQAFTAESLRNSVLKGVTFQLEVPKATNSEQVFNQMISIAQKMSNSLQARLIDDHQKPLGDLQIEKIRQQLKVIHATMVARGIMPGSPVSMRLFN